MRYLLFFTLFVTTVSAYSSGVLIAFGHQNSPYVATKDQQATEGVNAFRQGFYVDLVLSSFKLMGIQAKAEFMPIRALKKSLKNYETIDLAVGVNLSKDNYYYSIPLAEIENIAITKDINEFDVSSISDLMPYSVMGREGDYTRLGGAFLKLYHPKNGSHKSRYSENDNMLDLTKKFWNDDIDVIITDRFSFEHYSSALSIDHNVDEYITYHKIFPIRQRLYVAFKSKKLRDRFNKALETLIFDGSYQNLYDFYTKTNHILSQEKHYWRDQ